LTGVKGRNLHSWQVGVTEAKEIQRALAAQVVRSNELETPHLVAGVDISGVDSRGLARGAVVVLRLPELAIVEQGVATLRLSFPYVPGLLSFREVPLILAACEGLSVTPDLFIADAQGIAHPRRLGLASHLGLLLDVPTIGCAKSILCGQHGDMGQEPGDYAPLLDGDEVIGAALRTKRGVNPVYVSIGHRVDLEAAIHWVTACSRGYRLPEPTRLAHLAASGKKHPVSRAGQRNQ
jgi:deoxyribonuclease V